MMNRTVRVRFASMIVFVLALAWAMVAVSAADASLGELSFLGCIGQLSGCAVVPGEFAGSVEAPRGLAVSPDGKNVYAADEDANTIDVFSRNPVDGTLTQEGCVGQHGGCAVTEQKEAVERPFAVAVSADGKSVYAVSVGSNTVDEFSRNTASGGLTYAGCIGRLSGCVPTTPTEAISGPQSISISADGTSVYVASENAGGAVDEFQRNTTDGALKFESCIGAGGCAPVAGEPEALRLANAVVISPDGTSVYVGGQGASISTFARSTSTGALTFKDCVGNSSQCIQPSPLAVNEPTSLAVSPDGENLYAGNFANNAVDVFARSTSTGALTFSGCNGALVGQPGACTEAPAGNPGGPLTVAVSPDGADLYVASDQAVNEYSRGPAGALTFVGCTGDIPGVCTATEPEEAVAFPMSLALSPNGTSLYAGNESVAKALDEFGRATLPLCSDISAAVPYDAPAALTLSCSDADGKSVTYAIASGPAHGTLGALGSGGQVTYTPAVGYSGSDSFTFTAQNSDGIAAPATVHITVDSPAGSAFALRPLFSSRVGARTPLSTLGIATTPQAIEKLLLGCSDRTLVLDDVFIRGARVLLEGSAAKSLDGKKVKIVFDASKRVATATVGANGQFSTTAPLPAAHLRDSNSARYMAESGSQRSLDVKLVRRLSLQPPRFSAGMVTLTGQVAPPLTKPIGAVSVQQQLECGRTAIVKRLHALTQRTLPDQLHGARCGQGGHLQADEQRRLEARRQARLCHLQPAAAGDPRVGGALRVQRLL